MNARALALKTGQILGDLLANRVFGNRPVTLVGFSLGSLVIYEALKYLATLPSDKTADLIQDVYLFGTPAPSDPEVWSAIRRLVAGRLINGYSTNDYILAILSRAYDVDWHVAGLESVQVQGVENFRFDEVDGHLKWRGMVGYCLSKCGVEGVNENEVRRQLDKVAKPMADEMKHSEEQAEKLAKSNEAADNRVLSTSGHEQPGVLAH